MRPNLAGGKMKSVLLGESNRWVRCSDAEDPRTATRRYPIQVRY